jgi:hypothetical protein
MVWNVCVGTLRIDVPVPSSFLWLVLLVCHLLVWVTPVPQTTTITVQSGSLIIEFSESIFGLINPQRLSVKRSGDRTRMAMKKDAWQSI